MKTSVTTLLLGAMLTVLIFSDSSQAGNLEMTDEQNVKLARHKAMLRALRNNKDLDNYYDSSVDEQIRDGLNKAGCGSVDIGNVVKQDFGGPKKIDIIITGDVINANNKCN